MSVKQQKKINNFKTKPREETDHNQQLNMAVFSIAIIKKGRQ